MNIRDYVICEHILEAREEGIGGEAKKRGNRICCFSCQEKGFLTAKLECEQRLGHTVGKSKEPTNDK